MKVWKRQQINILKALVPYVLWKKKQSLFWSDIFFQYASVSLRPHQLKNVEEFAGEIFKHTLSEKTDM